MPKAAAVERTKRSRSTPISSTKCKNPKDSHLYTDDNPATTIHGTGFKDNSAAERTLELIKNRSLIYQFQTVNTMYNRAKHHPAMKKGIEGSASTSDMRQAMEVFRNWLDVTYPAEKDAQRVGGFKPLLSKKCVEQYMPEIENGKDVGEDAKAFAKVYVDLPKGKKLGNVLVDNSKPAEPDWERKRYECLDGLVPAGKDDAGAWKNEELWSADGKMTSKHLELVAWAWSPITESKLV